MTPFRFAVLVAVCVAWGLHFSVIKATISEVPPIFYVAMRMALVAALLIPFLKWHTGQMKFILAAAVCFGGLNYAFFFSGMKFVPASIGAILIEVYVPVAMIFSVIFLHEQVGWRRIFGAAMALGGVMIILSGGNEGLGPNDRLLLGGMLIMAGAVAEAAGAILVKKIDGVAPLQMLAWFGVVGALMAAVFTLLFERDQLAFMATPERTNIFMAILYSAVIASIFGHSCYYWLLQRVDVSQVAPAGLMTTV
ncbi:MAG: DMT family transporter, partial [Pseudomonadota bacterium]